jgi:hypothetical protein
MPWFEPCASHGYTKFLQNPSLRQDRFVVSDDYLASLLLAYRQGYVNAGGPDYEDTDELLLDRLSANCVGNTSGAAAMGAADARADRAAGQDAHPQSLSPGGAIPATAPINPPPVPTGQESGVVFSNIQGQPSENITMPYVPSSPGAASGAGGIGGAGGAGGAGGSGGSFSLPPWLIWVAIAGAAYFVWKETR